MVDEDRQEFHKLHEPTGQGTDERGHYLTIPLAMVRGGKTKPFNVYTDPMKHIINKSAPNPRGWYKSKHEPKRKRPRPCSTEATLTTPYGGFCPINCAHCVSGDALVATPDGDVRIDNLLVGDVVYGRVEVGLCDSEVLAVSKRQVESYYILNTADGHVLKVTGDHPILTDNAGWARVDQLREGDHVQTLLGLRCQHRESNAMEKVLCQVPLYPQGEKRSQIQQDQARTNGCDERSQDVRTMWQTYRPTQSEAMRCMSTATSCGAGTQKQRQTIPIEGQATIQGVKAQKRINIEEQQEFSRMYQVIEMAGGYGLENSQRRDGLQNQQAQAIHNEIWLQDNFSLRMGVANCAMARCEQHHLDIRGGGVFSGGFKGSISSRFPSVRFTRQSVENCRSEGVFSRRGSGAVPEIPDILCRGWDHIGVMEHAEAASARYTELTSMERVDEPLDVWDIQTTVENFYANGLLVHNCYINNGTRGYRATGLPTVNPDYPAAFRKRIDNLMVSGAGYITSFSEPFHPLESTYHITQQITQVFLDAGLPFFYLSRQLAPEWAQDALLKNPYSYMQWSINTSNPDHYSRFSPGAPPLQAMFDNMAEMVDSGIYISVQCNPIIAGITTLDDLLLLCDLVSEYGGHHIIFKFVEQVANNRQIIVDRMHSRKLPHVATFDNLFNHVIGGVYTIQQDVRIEWLNALLDRTRDVGLTMSLCYEYYADGGGGSSLAPWYTTSKGGCHGQTVPMFYRPEKGAPFESLPGCFESGCLYCAEYGTHACKNDKLLEASALQYKDLRTIELSGCDEDWELEGSNLPPHKMKDQYYWYPSDATFAEHYRWPTLEDLLYE